MKPNGHESEWGSSRTYPAGIYEDRRPGRQQDPRHAVDSSRARRRVLVVHRRTQPGRQLPRTRHSQRLPRHSTGSARLLLESDFTSHRIPEARAIRLVSGARGLFRRSLGRVSLGTRRPILMCTAHSVPRVQRDGEEIFQAGNGDDVRPAPAGEQVGDGLPVDPGSGRDLPQASLLALQGEPAREGAPATTVCAERRIQPRRPRLGTYARKLALTRLCHHIGSGFSALTPPSRPSTPVRLAVVDRA